MSDSDPEATPEQEARLRGLLADARHGDPIPVDVAARLDRVLDQLANEGPDTLEPLGEVADLAARRRRRVSGLLVAAAAVVVLGVGIGQVTRTVDNEDSSSTSAGASSAGARAETNELATSADDAQKDGPMEAGPGDSSAPLGPPAVSSMPPAIEPVRLTERGFAGQVVRFRDVKGFRATTGTSTDTQLSSSDAFMCAPADWGDGKLVPAVYDDLPAVLAYRPPSGTTQTVDLLRCGTAEVLRSTVLAQR